MNTAALNRAAINGSASVPIVSAEAAIVGVAEISAGATYIHEALGAGAGVAYVYAEAIRTTYADAFVLGAAEIVPNQTIIHASAAECNCTAEVVGYVLRTVFGAADVVGQAFVVAIPASILGSADIFGTASVTADATRQQPGAIAAVAEANIAADSTVTRYVSAIISAAATARVESGLNGVQDAYCDVVSGAEFTIVDVGVVFRHCSALADCSASVGGAGIIKQPGKANIVASGNISADGIVVANVAIVRGQGEAEIIADATRIVAPSAGIVAECVITAWSAQKHAVKCNAFGDAEIISIGARVVKPASSVFGSAEVTAQPVQKFVGLAIIIGTATVIADSRTNADAADPPDRTARRPYIDTVTRRPYTETTIRRAA